MGAHLRGRGWPATPSGEPATWPRDLAAFLPTVLATPTPSAILWGPELALFYNDACIPLIGRRHPEACGAPIREGWGDAWVHLDACGRHTLETGEGRSRTGVAIEIGGRETVWTFSLAPIYDEAGGVAGLLVQGAECAPPAIGEAPLPEMALPQRPVFQQMPAFVAMLQGPAHVFTYMNDAYVALVGARDIAGRPARDVFPDLAGQTFLALLDEVFATGEPFSARGMPVRFGDEGQDRFIDLLCQPLRDATGAVTGLFVGGYDTTESRRTAAALTESEARYRTLFDSIDQGFCVIEFIDGPHGPLSDYVHIEANPAYALHAGIPDVVGQNLRGMVPEEAEGWLELYGRVLRTGEPIRFERELVATGRHLELSAFRIEPASRRQVAVLFQDITARKRAEGALRDLNETLEARVALALAERGLLAEIVEGTDAFVQVADTEFRWLAINRAAADEFETIFGVRPAVGISMLDVLAHEPTHREAVRTIWSRALAGEAFTEVAAFGDPGRAQRHYEMKYNVLRGADGAIVGAYQFVYDVTDRIREQNRLAETEAALRQSQKMEAVGQLTGGVAHDFNNLLTIIRSSVDFLRRPDLPDARKQRYLDAVSDTVDRAAKLTGQLLAFARRQALKPEVFEVGARLKAVADMLDPVMGARIRVVTELSALPCHVRADVSQFETALVNMAVNARDAMTGEGRLTLTVHDSGPMPSRAGRTGPAGRFAAVSVTDTGSGMAPDQLPHIFEPFFTTKEVGKGTGLGLSQVFGFAKQSGGDVDVASTLGRGTTFTLYLPEVEHEIADPGPVEEFEACGAVGAGQRILVVEDNLDVGRFCTQILDDLGYATVWAQNAEEALATLGADGGGFDVVFSDVVMPGMGGLMLAQKLRTRFPALPVVLASGYSHVLAREDDHGFPLLHKPYSAEQLAGMLSRVSNRSGAGVREPAV